MEQRSTDTNNRNLEKITLESLKTSLDNLQKTVDDNNSLLISLFECLHKQTKTVHKISKYIVHIISENEKNNQIKQETEQTIKDELFNLGDKEKIESACTNELQSVTERFSYEDSQDTVVTNEGPEAKRKHDTDTENCIEHEITLETNSNDDQYDIKRCCCGESSSRTSSENKKFNLPFEVIDKIRRTEFVPETFTELNVQLKELQNVNTTTTSVSEHRDITRHWSVHNDEPVNSGTKRQTTQDNIPMTNEFKKMTQTLNSATYKSNKIRKFNSTTDDERLNNVTNSNAVLNKVTKAVINNSTIKTTAVNATRNNFMNVTRRLSDQNLAPVASTSCTVQRISQDIIAMTNEFQKGTQRPNHDTYKSNKIQQHSQDSVVTNEVTAQKRKQDFDTAIGIEHNVNLETYRNDNQYGKKGCFRGGSTPRKTVSFENEINNSHFEVRQNIRQTESIPETFNELNVQPEVQNVNKTPSFVEIIEIYDEDTRDISFNTDVTEDRGLTRHLSDQNLARVMSKSGTKQRISEDNIGVTNEFKKGMQSPKYALYKSNKIEQRNRTIDNEILNNSANKITKDIINNSTIKTTTANVARNNVMNGTKNKRAPGGSTPSNNHDRHYIEQMIAIPNELINKVPSGNVNQITETTDVFNTFNNKPTYNHISYSDFYKSVFTPEVTMIVSETPLQQKLGQYETSLSKADVQSGLNEMEIKNETKKRRIECINNKTKIENYINESYTTVTTLMKNPEANGLLCFEKQMPTLKYTEPSEKVAELVKNTRIYYNRLIQKKINENHKQCKRLTKLLMFEVFNESAMKECDLSKLHPFGLVAIILYVMEHVRLKNDKRIENKRYVVKKMLDIINDIKKNS